jgi:serine/threonine-protein kinase
VAIKRLPDSSLDDLAGRARLLREARTASRLNHPHICTICEVGEAVPLAEGLNPSDTPALFIDMELVRGATLSARLAPGAMAPAEVARIGLQLADGLARAHARGVVHRDLKSANIVITPEGRAKILDFGLAKTFHGPEEGDAAPSAAPTATMRGTVTGTLAYMSPEQLRGQPADTRSDVWALGVVLHEMATGTLPFHGETGYALSPAILNEPPAPLPASVPGALRAIVGSGPRPEGQPCTRGQRAPRGARWNWFLATPPATTGTRTCWHGGRGRKRPSRRSIRRWPSTRSLPSSIKILGTS